MKTIYCLKSSSDNATRYIGQTGYPLHKRLKAHVQAAQRRLNPLHEWVLREHTGGRLQISAICVAPDDVADQSERRLIQAERSKGLLLNQRDGWYTKRDRSLLRPINVASDDNGTFFVTCPSMPEVTTFAATADEIVRRANDAIEEALFAQEAA